MHRIIGCGGVDASCATDSSISGSPRLQRSLGSSCQPDLYQYLQCVRPRQCGAHHVLSLPCTAAPQFLMHKCSYHGLCLAAGHSAAMAEDVCLSSTRFEYSRASLSWLTYVGTCAECFVRTEPRPGLHKAVSWPANLH